MIDPPSAKSSAKEEPPRGGTPGRLLLPHSGQSCLVVLGTPTAQAGLRLGTELELNARKRLGAAELGSQPMPGEAPLAWAHPASLRNSAQRPYRSTPSQQPSGREAGASTEARGGCPCAALGRGHATHPQA